MGGSNTTLTQADTRLSNIRVQTSSQGLPLAKGWGRYRSGCNLIWYGNFVAIEHKSVQEQGGKGGGGGVTSVTITYTYEAAIMVAIGHGPIMQVVSAWKGKQRLQGEPIPEQRTIKTHEFTMPNLGGDFNFYWANASAPSSTHVVTVPDAGALTRVIRVAKKTGRAVGNTRSSQAMYGLKEGTHYTSSGGVFTFNAKAEPGKYVISYEVISVAAGWLSVLGQLNMSLANGYAQQPVWSWLNTEHPDQALTYPGMAYLYSPNYALTSAAELHNHNFEVSTGTELGLLPGRTEPVLDADPAVIIDEVISNDTWGVGWRDVEVSGLDRLSDYCVANGFWLSPVLEEQQPAAELLQDILRLTNSNCVFDGEVMTFKPLGDQDITANGRTFVADVTPVVDLTWDHFECGPGEGPIKIRRHFGQDGSSELADGDDVGYNIWTLEIENRANGYNAEPTSYEDTAHIIQHGRRQKPTIKARAIKDPTLGQTVATLLCQSELSRRNTYEFRLPWTLGFLLPLDLVTITDPIFGLVRKPVMLETVEEEGDVFFVTARDADIGIASAPTYGAQAGAGFAHDYNVSPGYVAAPVIFEPPVELSTETGLAVWVAVTGTSTNWGGCEVWASTDGGATYKRMGESLGGGARYGDLMSTVASGTGAAVDVQLRGRGGQMLSASVTDAEGLASLIYVRDSDAADPEYMAYQGATLSATNRYTLDGLVRGGYDSKVTAHAAAGVFVRVDESVVKSEPLQLNMIGKTIKFKFRSFNVFRGALQELEDVPEYAYVITGNMASLPPRNVTSFTMATQADGTRVFAWGWGSVAKPIDLDGCEMRYRQGFGWDWDDMLPFVTDEGFFTSSPLETNQLLAGDYTFAIKSRDKLGVLAKDALHIEGRLPDPRLGNALVDRQLHAEGWPGTLTDCLIENSGGNNILRARDQAVWTGGASNIPTTWDAWTRWVWDPVSSMTYQAPTEDFGAIVSVLPTINAQTNGLVSLEEQHSNDNTTYTAWAPVAGVVLARYIRVRITITVPGGSPSGPGLTPVLVVETASLSYIGRVDKEYGNDISPAALTGLYRIAAGHFRLPTGKDWVFYSRVGITLQGVGAGWTWELVDKDLVTGPAIKTYNASNVLADPPLIDFDIEGIVA